MNEVEVKAEMLESLLHVYLERERGVDEAATSTVNRLFGAITGIERSDLPGLATRKEKDAAIVVYARAFTAAYNDFLNEKFNNR